MVSATGTKQMATRIPNRSESRNCLILKVSCPVSPSLPVLRLKAVTWVLPPPFPFLNVPFPLFPPVAITHDPTTRLSPCLTCLDFKAQCPRRGGNNPNEMRCVICQPTNVWYRNNYFHRKCFTAILLFAKYSLYLSICTRWGG
jgi:hypothetical protein